jgi:hypothetical protein
VTPSTNSRALSEPTKSSCQRFICVTQLLGLLLPVSVLPSDACRRLLVRLLRLLGLGGTTPPGRKLGGAGYMPLLLLLALALLAAAAGAGAPLLLGAAAAGLAPFPFPLLL